MRPIVLKVYKEEDLPSDLRGMVRITPEAETIVRELQRASGLSLRHIASEIIIQAADYVEIKEVSG